MIPPQFLEGERAILGACLLENECVPKVTGALQPEDFYENKSRLIFSAILEISRKNVTVDWVTLTAALKEAGCLESIGGPQYLTELVEAVPSAANVMHYVEMVKEKANLRRILAVSREIASQCLTADCEVSQVRSFFQKSAFELLPDTRERATQHISAVLLDSINTIKHATEKSIPCGFSSLDSYTGGFYDGDFTLIAARPRVGKTSLAAQIARHVARRNVVLVCSLEMPSRQIGLRYISEGTGINLKTLRKGYVGGADWGPIQDVAGRLSDLNLYLDETPRVTVESLLNKCRQLSVKIGRKVDMVVIDYIQLMGSKGKYENQNVKLETISRGLKLLARELDIPVIALSQLNRDLEKREFQDKKGNHLRKPQLSDLRGSGAFEQDADNIIFLYRPEVYSDASEFKGFAEAIIAKQRNGEQGIARLVWNGPTTSFSDPELRHNERDYMEGI